MVALTPGGTLKARIDLDKMLGAGMANIEDFAPGPDGEIYVVATRIWEHFERDQSGRIIERSRVRDSTLWLVRFNDTGQFLAKTQIEVDYFAYIRIAVFPSGSFLVVGYLSHPTRPAFGPRRNWNRFREFFLGTLASCGGWNYPIRCSFVIRGSIGTCGRLHRCWPTTATSTL